MNNQDILRNVFAEALNIDLSEVNDDLAFSANPHWDSVAHMALVAALEMKFNIMLDIDDVINMSSVAKAKEILTTYGIEFKS